MNNENKNSSQTGSFATLALVRLALLVVPIAVAIKTLSFNPVVCIVACVAILSVWLSVDCGPFRAEQDAAEVKTVAAKFSPVQALSQAAFRLMIFAIIFQARLTNY